MSAIWYQMWNKILAWDNMVWHVYSEVKCNVVIWYGMISWMAWHDITWSFTICCDWHAWFNVMRCDLMWSDVLWSDLIWWDVMWSCVMWCGLMSCDAMRCDWHHDTWHVMIDMMRMLWPLTRDGWIASVFGVTDLRCSFAGPPLSEHRKGDKKLPGV